MNIGPQVSTGCYRVKIRNNHVTKLYIARLPGVAIADPINTKLAGVCKLESFDMNTKFEIERCDWNFGKGLKLALFELLELSPLKRQRPAGLTLITRADW